MMKDLNFGFYLPLVNLNLLLSTTLDSAVPDAFHFPQGFLSTRMFKT